MYDPTSEKHQQRTLPGGWAGDSTKGSFKGHLPCRTLPRIWVMTAPLLLLPSPV